MNTLSEADVEQAALDVVGSDRMDRVRVRAGDRA